MRIETLSEQIVERRLSGEDSFLLEAILAHDLELSKETTIENKWLKAHFTDSPNRRFELIIK